ncbi:MAG TPA: hypothetical protein VGB05_02850 [Pyrinomonadaceae bacterium]|jgi:hypothetical protein
MLDMFRDSLTNRMVEFLTGIGIELEPARLDGEGRAARMSLKLFSSM